MFGSSSRTYLDHAAAAPVSAVALRAFTKALARYGNPSAPHQEGREARAVLEEARTVLARHAGAKSEMVVFTGNATEANALAIEGVARGKEAHLLYMEGAHASVANTMEALKKQGANVEMIPLKDGALDLDALRKLLRPETLLVSMEAISSETGLRADARGVRHILDESETRVFLHVDASQVPLVEAIDRTRFGADLVTLDASKVGGVRGIGALIYSAGVPLSPIIQGGGQERGLRSGTETPALAASFAAAIEEAARMRDSFTKKANILRMALVQGIKEKIPDAFINEGKENAPHILNISFPGRDTDYLVALLDEAGFAVSTRSACETDSEEGSRAVFALTRDRERASSTLRISFGPSTSEGEAKRFIHALGAAVAFLDRKDT